MARKPKTTGQTQPPWTPYADTLVEGLSNGIPLRELCRKHSVSKSAVYRWMEADADFRGRIARAREIGRDEIFEECMSIADDNTNDYVERKNADGSTYEQFNADHVQRQKLRIETRLKLLAKWDPKRYGDKVALTGGSEEDRPISVNLTALPEEKLEQLRSILVAASQSGADRQGDSAEEG